MSHAVRIMRPRCLSLAVLVGLLGCGLSPAVASQNPRQRARDLLRGHLFDRFTEQGVLGDTLDQRLSLCSNGSFVYDTVSYLPETGTTTTNRTTGRWRVLSAQFHRHEALARVGGVPDGGGRPTTVSFVRQSGGRVTIDGLVVSVQRSDVCR
jgi:hypothetical protein